MSEKKLGWIFGNDGYEGIPYLRCPYCNRRIGGKTAIFASEAFNECPDCGEELHFDNIKEEDWLYMWSYFGENE